MSLFLIYTFGAAPFYLWLFVRHERTFGDVKLDYFVPMFIVSFVPIFRECCVLYLFGDFVIFKGINK